MTPSATDIEVEANLVSEFYDLDKSSLLSERKIVAASLSLHKKEEVLSATHKIAKWLHEDGIGMILPTYKSAATILASIPATSCSAERSFSALRRIKPVKQNDCGPLIRFKNS